jgi:transposase-like protein
MARALQHHPATQFFELQTTRSTDPTTTIKKTCHAYCHDHTMTSDSLSSGGIAIGGRSGRRLDGATSAEREELRRLRRDNKRLRQEREILAKAAAWFARETNSMPPKSSDS